MFNSMSSDTGGMGSQLFQFAAQTNAANIDWAQLAQQWIAQNSGENLQKTVAEGATTPSLPNLSGTRSNGKRSSRSSSRFEEKGEADMDMDDEVPPAPPILTESSDTDVQWLTQQSGHIDTGTNWNIWPNSNNAAVMPTQFSKNNSTAHIPSLLKINVPNPNELSKPGENASGSSGSTTTLDAAKRKVLPAWIREGLEKMEREKQKQLEREQQLKERGQTSINIGLNDENMVNSTLQASDDEDDESSVSDVMSNINKFRNIDQHFFKSSQSNEDGADDDEDDDTNVSLANISKSYEQRLAELMITVRRTLTELLLEVTNDEIAHIAQDTLNLKKMKASSAQVVRKSALSSITNKLGLAAYSSSGESDSDDSVASNDDHRRRASSVGTNTAGEDSEEEIKNKLRMRRRAFAKISDEIEERVAANAAREEQKLKYYKQKELEQQQCLDNNESEDSTDGRHRNRKNASEVTGMGKNYERDFGETTTDSKLQSSNGKRARERGSTRRGERTTRFSDNKDTTSITAATASYISQLATAGASTVSTNATSLSTSRTTTIPQYPITGSTKMPEAITKLQSIYTPTSAAAAGINSMLSAADAALEKASKSKNMSKSITSSHRHDGDYHDDDRRDRERERDRRRHRHDSRRHTSDESSDSTDSSDTSKSTNSSRHSKYSRTSSTSNSRHKHQKSSTRSEHRRHHSSRNRDRERERYYNDRFNSSTKSSYKTERSSSSSKHSRRDRSRSRNRDRSRSRSTYSSSSSKRHRH